jgi:hypothetical protein
MVCTEIRYKYLRYWHCLPIKPPVQVQVLGKIHFPPFWQSGLQTARSKTSNKYVNKYKEIINLNCWKIIQIDLHCILSNLKLIWRQYIKKTIRVLCVTINSSTPTYCCIKYYKDQLTDTVGDVLAGRIEPFPEHLIAFPFVWRHSRWELVSGIAWRCAGTGNKLH